MNRIPVINYPECFDLGLSEVKTGVEGFWKQVIQINHALSLKHK